jgi:hypothetical protein
MRLVTPEKWYIAWWCGAGLVFLVAEFFIVKWAIISAADYLRRFR